METKQKTRSKDWTGLVYILETVLGPGLNARLFDDSPFLLESLTVDELVGCLICQRTV
jgi:hypothetical protein